MCGRARCSFTRRQALQCAQASRWVSGEEQYEPRQNASPGHWLPVIVYEGEGKERVLKGLRWGMGRDKESDPFKAFNARAETCEEKPMFKHHLKQHRCCVMVNGFYEWNEEDAPGKKVKQPYYLHTGDGSGEEVMLLAGLYNEWPDGGGSFTIVTVDASKRISWLHDRMPAILPDEEAAQRWMDVGFTQSIGDVKKLLQPFDKEELSWWPVHRRMSKPSYEAEDVAKPVTREGKRGTSDISSFFTKQGNKGSEGAQKRPAEAPEEAASRKHKRISDQHHEEGSNAQCPEE